MTKVSPFTQAYQRVRQSTDRPDEAFEVADISSIVRINATVENRSDPSPGELEADERAARQVIIEG